MIRISTLTVSLLFVALIFSSCSSSENVKTNDSFQAVKLPDNSIALLNQNSSIEYNKDFKSRIVKQTGEVFYMVEEGISPFIVETNKDQVLVVGTEFNVKADNEELEVEVESGTVKLTADKVEKDIRRGERAVVSEAEKGIQVAKAEFDYKGWTKNLNSDLEKLGREINRGAKQLEKETKRLGKDINKELKKLGN
ncbi:FecR family protein [Marinoscillum pacificum]|uniref:FecR family protein n=1 Tax=Marinoscillum pacificum TaxID=392723 RepID=UPI002157296A|nr:FecR family protein [Marinoscillum pacificum]